MRGVSNLLLVLAVSALLALGLTACGGDSNSDSTAASGPSATSTAAETKPSQPTEDHGGGEKEDGGVKGGSKDGEPSDSGPNAKGSQSFLVPGGDNSVQNYGSEADTAELQEVEGTIAAFLDARAAGNWPRVCAYLSKSTLQPIEQMVASSPQLKGKGCGALLDALSGASPPQARANTMTHGLASFRADGEQGFALYHGAQGVDYFLVMRKEDGVWKAGAIAPSEFLNAE